MTTEGLYKAHGGTITNSIHGAKRSTLHAKVRVDLDSLLVDLVWQITCNLGSEWIHGNSGAPKHKICGNYVFCELPGRLILLSVDNVIRMHRRDAVCA